MFRLKESSSGQVLNHVWYLQYTVNIKYLQHIAFRLRISCRNILHEIRKRKANWIGHILRRNCLLQRVIEGKILGGIEVTGRQGSRRRKLLDDLNRLNAELNPICHLLALLGVHHFLHVCRIRVKEMRGYPHLKEEALDRTMWRARFGRGFGPVVRQTTKWMNTHSYKVFTHISVGLTAACPWSECCTNKTRVRHNNNSSIHKPKFITPRLHTIETILPLLNKSRIFTCPDYYHYINMAECHPISFLCLVWQDSNSLYRTALLQFSLKKVEGNILYYVILRFP